MPINPYGQSKLAGERLVTETTDDYLLFRVSWVFGDGKQNFFYKMLQAARKNDTLRIVDDQVSIPTSTRDIVRFTMLALDKGLRGLYHLTASGRASRHKTLDLASGYFLTKSKLHRSAQEAVEKALRYAYVGRRNKKRDFRSLWIVRINAGCRQAGITYSKFMHGLKAAGVALDRKVLAEVAANDPTGFGLLVEKAKAALEQAS